jgi:uncharacterized protein (DUF111 family)
LIKSNREDKRKKQLIVKETNYGKMEIETEQTKFREIMRLYGEEAYSQQCTSPIAVMETILKMREDIGRHGVKYFKENMNREIEFSYLYHLLDEIITR